MSKSKIDLLVDIANDGRRLDAYIAEHTDLSRSRVKQLLDEQCVLIDNQLVKKASSKVKASQTIEVNVPEPISYDVEAENINIEIVYEDSDVIVINKAANLVVHPAPGHYSGTLVNALLYHCHDLSGINGVMRPGIVHRLDKDTSGLIIVAKNDFAHASLSAQLKQRLVSRVYLAIVHGHFKVKKGTVNTLIGRHRNNRLKMAVLTKSGKSAITHYRVLEEYSKYSLVELRLETGRTHQIRVHLAHLNHHVAGDPLYGLRKEELVFPNGQWLHATRLKFIHPRKQIEIKLECAPPPERLALLNTLRQEIGVDIRTDGLVNS